MSRLVTIISIVSLCVLFSSEGIGQVRVYKHLLPAVSTGPLDPAWSPAGDFLAFAARGDIWKIPVAGGIATGLTHGPAYYSEPAFSPDGKKIALTMDIEGNLEIGLLDAEGGSVERLTDHSDLDFAPAWAPDGKALYFVSDRYGSLDVLRLDLDSGEVAKIVAGSGNEYQPAVSPDGKRLAYVGPVDNRLGSGGIWALSLKSGEAHLVHYEESSYRMKPAWSPDGETLSYISDVAGTNDVAIIPASGGNPIKLTYDELGDEFDPALSPDGKRIAFVSNREGPTRLYVIPVGGSDTENWSQIGISDRKPSFPTGIVRGRVVDENGDLVPARLMLSASDGRSYTEDGGFHRVVPATRTHYQHIDGVFEIEVPIGETSVEVMKGFEFRPDKDVIDVKKDETVEVELQLERIDSPSMRGWYSGDMHVHDLHEGRYGLTHKDFFRQLTADDVEVTNALIHMDGTKLMGRWDDLTGAPHPLSNENHILRYSQEFRGGLGHVGLIGIRQFMMPLIAGASNTAFAYDMLPIGHIDAAHDQGAITGFVHPYSGSVEVPSDVSDSGVPVLAGLNRGDFYDVVSAASSERASAKMYYRLLNTGVEIAATGGTDNFSDVWFDPSAGTARTYARIGKDEAFNFESWIRAVERGRTFATSGPLIFLSVDGRQPGDRIRLTKNEATELNVEVDVRSIVPINKVEIIRNGEIVRTWDIDKDGSDWHFETTVNAPNGGWIAARAIGPSHRYVGDDFAFAQTSPIYIIRAEKRFKSVADARFLLEAVNQLWQQVKARDAWRTKAQEDKFRRHVEGAEAFYQRVIRTHTEH